MDLRSEFDIPASAVVLAEGEFGETGGKTANGVVMQSEIFEATAVIDSTNAGSTADEILTKPGTPAVPVVGSFSAALEADPDPDALVIGVAPPGGDLPASWVETIREAMANGCDVVSGLHVFLGDHPEWREFADECGVRLFDVRKPPEFESLRVADGRVDDVDADVVLTMGTDCAVGKRTTTFELYRAARRAGHDVAWVASGQTGIMVGAHRGVVVDRVPADFAAGVVENMVCAVAREHDLVFVEGQASLTHRAYSGVTLSILHGAWPDAIVLTHDPNRQKRTLFEQFDVDGVEADLAAIDALANAPVAGISTWGDPTEANERHGVPAADVFDENGPEELLAFVTNAL